MRLDRRVREKHRQRYHPFIQIVHQRRHLGKQILSNLSPEQAPARGQNDQLAQRVQQIHLPFVSPLLEERVCFFHHHPDVRSQAFALQRIREESKLFRSRLVIDVEHNPFPERRHVKFVHFFLRHFHVFRFEEKLRHFRTEQKRDAFMAHRNTKHFPVCRERIRHESHRPFQKLQHAPDDGDSRVD